MRNPLFPTMTFFVFFGALMAPQSAFAGPDMIKIPSGSFAFGPDKKKVTVSDFMIDKTEVTNAFYKEIVKEHNFPAGKENHPVVEVSHDDATDYCKAKGKRLPTGKEWERAARGDDGRQYPWGNDFSTEMANTTEKGVDGTMPVGSLPKGASPYGVLDMCGNVAEWVDEADEKMDMYRRRRGGSFFDTKENSTTFSRSNAFYDDQHPYAGFRCAK